MKTNQEQLLSMEKAKQLVEEVLAKIRSYHRHKSYMGGCEECAIIAKIKVAVEELNTAQNNIHN
jgi:hypothetical protein